MSDKLYTLPVVGWILYDKNIGSITDNHGNRVTAWSTTCSNGHREGWRGLSGDRVSLEIELKLAAASDLAGVVTGTVDLGDLPSPIAHYCERMKSEAELSR